jgi:hypothetical protein
MLQFESKEEVVNTIDIKEDIEGVSIISFKIEKKIERLEKIKIMQKKKAKFECHTKYTIKY